MKGLVTGASGFLGGAVAEAAAAAGWTIATAGRKELCDLASWTHTVRATAPDVVLHFAGSASVGDSLANPDADFAASTALTQRVLEGVRQSGQRPTVVLASSAAVYGSPETLPVSESAPFRPESPYGFHKVLAETLGREYAACFGLNVLALRYFSIFGPRQRRLLIWEIFSQMNQAGHKVRLRGTGAEERDYLSAEEAAFLTVRAVDRFRAQSEGFLALNLASGSSLTIREAIVAVEAALGCRADVSFGGDTPSGNPARWMADVQALRRMVPDWTPLPFAVAIQRCVAAWRQTSSCT